ncbi:MAG: PQQ-binding-like beta-propeller repeat protein [Verrucomicrobiae bacterium]
MDRQAKAWGLSARIGMLAFIFGATCAFGRAPFSEPPKKEPIALIVMDPLAKELACACVKGYAGRDYGKLAARLEKALRHHVIIEFSDSLSDSMSKFSPGQEVIVIGKRSVVLHDAEPAGLKCHPVCELTGKDGGTTITGLFVARSDDTAKELKDINGRRVFFGPADADEKYSAAIAAMGTAGITPPATPETRSACSDGALDILDSKQSPPPVAVISSYALPLLEGCGSIKKGDLKVIGETEPVPFVTAFVSENISAAEQQNIIDALLSIRKDAKMLQAMESRDGFIPMPTEKPKILNATPARDWPDWRGPERDGHVPRLPARLPDTTKFIWKKAAMIGSLAGLSVSDGRLILAERDFSEEHDVYRCLNAKDGELVWRIEFPAPGKLDYGQFPRATPVIHDGKVYLLGAFGHLRCVRLTDGKLVWARNLPREFKAGLPTWGMCSTPLIVDDMVIVNPGAANASLAALDSSTGRTRWTTPGLPAAYSSFICGEFGGRRQIVGYDQHSLGGWEVKTGARLWQLIPSTEGDFNVTTPVAMDGKLIVSTENNGTRLYGFDDSGKIIPQPLGDYAGLSPDTATPVVTGGRVFGAHLGLHCLDARQHLKRVWQWKDDNFGDHASFIADGERVLVITLSGELLLLAAGADHCEIISRLRVFEDDVEIYSHPAAVGNKLFIRGGSIVACVDLMAN